MSRRTVREKPPIVMRSAESFSTGTRLPSARGTVTSSMPCNPENDSDCEPSCAGGWVNTGAPGSGVADADGVGEGDVPGVDGVPAPGPAPGVVPGSPGRGRPGPPDEEGLGVGSGVAGAHGMMIGMQRAPGCAVAACAVGGSAAPTVEAPTTIPPAITAATSPRRRRITAPSPPDRNRVGGRARNPRAVQPQRMPLRRRCAASRR